MDRRAFVQLAVVAASLTTISVFLLYGAYRKKQQGGAPDSVAKLAAPKDVSAPAHAAKAHDAPKPAKKESAPAPAGQKKPPPAPEAVPPVNIGQEEATLATKKYKAGAYGEAIELYTLAIEKCEKVVPLDVRNVKVMYSNRAAAYEKLEDHQHVIMDCSKALKLDNRCVLVAVVCVCYCSSIDMCATASFIAATRSRICAEPRRRRLSVTWRVPWSTTCACW